jgi:hypothetical protein
MVAMDRRTAMALGAAMLAPAVLQQRPAKAEMYARHAGIEVLAGVRRRSRKVLVSSERTSF